MTSLKLNSFQMLDTETVGVNPGCSLLVIGAVRFDPFSVWPENGQDIAHKDQFLIRISRESNLRHGMIEEPDSLAFWEKQSDEAKEEAFGGKTDLKEALVLYREWCLDTFGTDKDGKMDANTYCHGATFDQPLVSYALHKLGIPNFFPYNRTRDTRSQFELANIYYKGKSHRAVLDCFDQCAAICEAHNRLGFSRERGILPDTRTRFQFTDEPFPNLG